MELVRTFRKKPVEIKAIQWAGDNLQDCIEFLGNSYFGHNADRTPNGKAELIINTLEGHHVASRNDWLIRGVHGEHYPCKPDIFEKTYEEVDNEPTATSMADIVKNKDAYKEEFNRVLSIIKEKSTNGYTNVRIEVDDDSLRNMLANELRDLGFGVKLYVTWAIHVAWS